MPFNKVYLLPFLMVLLSSCASLPQDNLKTIKFQDAESFQGKETDSNNVRIFESEYPNGIVKDGDLIKVQAGFEDKIKILGKVSVNLVQGKNITPFVMGPHFNAYVNQGDLTGTYNFCAANAWEGYLDLLGYIFPWNIPCYFIKDYSGEKPEDIGYREDTLKNYAKKEAARLGGNVVGFDIGGITVFEARNGTELANKTSWSATGYVIYMSTTN